MKSIEVVLLVVVLLSPATQAIPGPWVSIPSWHPHAYHVAQFAAQALLGSVLLISVVDADGADWLEKKKRYGSYRVFFFADDYFFRAFVYWSPTEFLDLLKTHIPEEWGTSDCWRMNMTPIG